MRNLKDSWSAERATETATRLSSMPGTCSNSCALRSTSETPIRRPSMHQNEGVVAGRRSSLTPVERVIAAASALDSVRAEGLDPSGIEHELSRWVRGEVTITEVIQRELHDAQRVYGPPTGSA